MKTLFLYLLSGICITLTAQTDSIYYFNKLNRACNISTADYMVVVRKNNKNTYIQKTEKINKKLERILDDEVKVIITGDSTFEIKNKVGFITKYVFYRCDSGYLITEPEYNKVNKGFSKNLFPIIKSGVWKSYSKTNKVKLSEDIYEENELMHNLNWNDDGTAFISDVFAFTETQPLFMNKDLSSFQMKVAQEVRYPVLAVENGISGKVYLQFVVLKDGTVNGLRLLRGVHPDLDSEAIRATKSVMGTWTPATIRGNAVNAYIVIPVVFRLQE